MKPKIKKSVVPFLLFFVILIPSRRLIRSSDNEVLQKAQKLIETGRYDEGVYLLRKTAHDQASGDAARVRALMKLADFYAQRAGNFDEAKRYYRRIIELQIDVKRPFMDQAARAIERIEMNEQQYSNQDIVLANLRRQSAMPKSRKAKKRVLRELSSFIEDNPDYYRLHEALYFQALNHADLMRYGKAADLLDSCLKIKPAMDFYLPVSKKIAEFKKEGMRRLIKNLSRLIAGAFLFTAALLFFKSAPWKNATFRDLLLLFAVVALWAFIFGFSILIISHRFHPGDDFLMQIHKGKNIFISAEPGSPGWSAALHLFLYGVWGIFVLFAFVFGFKMMRLKKLKTFMCAVFGFLLFGALTAGFYLEHLDGRSIFISEKKGISRYIDGYFCIPVDEPEAYILTNPRKFPNLDMTHIEEGVFKDWIISHNGSETSPVREGEQ